MQQQLLALVRADSTDEAGSEQDSGLICERQCGFQCFTASGSPEDTPVFVPKFRLVVSLLYFSSAMMFLHDLLWIKYAFQVFIPASDILRLYLDRNIMQDTWPQTYSALIDLYSLLVGASAKQNYW